MENIKFIIMYHSVALRNEQPFFTDAFTED